MVAAPLAGAGFRLSDLGGPREAGARFLATVVAPPGSGRTTELLGAMERCARAARVASCIAWRAAEFAVTEALCALYLFSGHSDSAPSHGPWHIHVEGRCTAWLNVHICGLSEQPCAAGPCGFPGHARASAAAPSE